MTRGFYVGGHPISTCDEVTQAFAINTDRLVRADFDENTGLKQAIDYAHVWSANKFSRFIVGVEQGMGHNKTRLSYGGQEAQAWYNTTIELLTLAWSCLRLVIQRAGFPMPNYTIVRTN